MRLNDWERRLMKEAEAEGGAEGASADMETGSDESTDYGEFADTLEGYDRGDESNPESEAESDEGEKAEDESAETESESDAEEDNADDSESDEDSDDVKDEDKEADEEDDDSQEEEAKELTPEEVEAQRKQYMDSYAEKFQFSDEEIDSLRTEPEKVLPGMLAKVHTETMEMVVNVLRQNMPQMVNQQLQTSQVHQKAENQFFEKFEELKTPKAMKVAEQMARAYRQANPKATTEEMIENVGLMTWRKMGLPMDKLAEKLSGGAGQMNESIERSGKEKRQKQGYVPEKGSKEASGPQGQGQKEGQTIFEEMANLLDSDDF